MKEQLEIKTGANLSALLQSTVNFPQAFTEIIKNSIQNFATIIEIKLNHKEVSVTDNGKGFDHNKDYSGKNDFDKYFIFGNSYDNTGGKGIRLGHMGIGGKLANDKLSSKTPNWSIFTKNVHQKSFVVNYNPPKGIEFLDDYQPELKEIDYNKNHFQYDTGTKILINSLSRDLINKQDQIIFNVKKEIKSFFFELLQEHPNIKIIFNEEDLSFDFKLPGIPFLNKTVDFEYLLEQKKSKGKIKFNIAKTNAPYKDNIIDGIQIVSGVKISQFNLENHLLINDIYNSISEKEKKEINVEPAVLSFFRNLVGFISCKELSNVLDDSNMPAKDLSHHKIREDHPVTLPFLKSVYKEIIYTIREEIGLDKDKKKKDFDNIAKKVLDLINENIEDIQELSYLQDQEFDYTVKKSLPDGYKPEDFIHLPQNLPDIVNEEIASSIKEKLVDEKKANDKIIYEIVDFGEDSEYEISSSFFHKKLVILINSENSKFKELEILADGYSLACHISECLVKEVFIYNNPESNLREVEFRLSQFYKEFGSLIKDKFSVI